METSLLTSRIYERTIRDDDEMEIRTISPISCRRCKPEFEGGTFISLTSIYPYVHSPIKAINNRYPMNIIISVLTSPTIIQRSYKVSTRDGFPSPRPPANAGPQPEWLLQQPLTNSPMVSPLGPIGPIRSDACGIATYKTKNEVFETSEGSGKCPSVL